MIAGLTTHLKGPMGKALAQRFDEQRHLEGSIYLYRTPPAALLTLGYPNFKFLWHSRAAVRMGY
jgi:hypothetical protein